MPYIDYLVGDEIRMATRNAVQTVIRERIPEIEAQVRAALSSETIVASMSKAIVTAAEQDWRIAVNFETEKR